MITNVLNNKLFFVIAFLLGFSLKSYADSSVKLVQWWDEYFPTTRYAGDPWYRSANSDDSLQYQDVNGDGVYNDATIWYEFSLAYPLNPGVACAPKSVPKRGYRIDRPSARFYGGMIARFTNVSHLLNDKDYPLFDHFQQATAQPMDGGHLSVIYNPHWPHNTARGRRLLIDMTVMVVNCCSAGLSDTFQKTKDAEVNFSSIFLWKKEDFVNGGSTAKQITFDDTSMLSADVTRMYLNIKEGRFVVQDGNHQLWISEAFVTTNEGSQSPVAKNGIDVEKFDRLGFTVKLRPLDSLWSVYDPFSDEELLKSVVAELKEKNKDFNKKTVPDADYKEKSSDFLKQVNKMDFRSENSVFVEHIFEDIQAVGVYFATLDFAHETTQLVFDNFQVYGKINFSEEQPSVSTVSSPSDSGDIPGTAMDIKGNNIATKTIFKEDVSVKGDATTVIRTTRSDQLDIRGIIIPDNEHVGKEVDIIVVVGYKPHLEEQESFFMFGKEGQILPWNGNISDLVAFQDKDILKEISNSQEEELVTGPVVLTPERQVRIFPVTVSSSFWEDKEVLFGCERPLLYTGKLNEIPPGFFRFFFGYRLREEGTVVFNSRGIDVIITDD
jgi:hypothetical protein